MGGSNEEHMLLCFNRAAHCARKGILYSHSDLSQWKPELSLSQLSLQYPSATPPPPFPPLFFFNLNLHAFIFACCTYVISFVPQDWGTMLARDLKTTRCEGATRRANIRVEATTFQVPWQCLQRAGGGGASQRRPPHLFHIRLGACMRVSACHRLHVCALVSACISVCLCGSEFRHQ